MSKHVVRKIRNTDPEHIRRMADFGLSWLVFRSASERPGRAFTSHRNAIFWATRDYVWLAS